MIEDIIKCAVEESSNLNEKAIQISGMSSVKVRHLLNKAVSYPNTKYLEIGVWNGSTFYSALCNNHPDYAVAIDNFSEFGGQERIFRNNMQGINVDYTFINKDCFTVDTSTFKTKFNVYFYDGGHDEDQHEKALTYFYDSLEDSFLFICDDYDWDRVKNETKNGIKKLGLTIVEEKILSSHINEDKNWFWNGVYIALLRKK